MLYSLIRKSLFQFTPETSHTIALNALNIMARLSLLSLFYPSLHKPCSLMGLNFPNPIGLAAGLDKNADYLDALGELGFGFIEIGTVTPKAQTGNPKPRLFRLEKQKAIINRMGFNSKGIDYVVNQLKKSRYHGILGVNIGKNKETPNEEAVDDYLKGLAAFWPYASYITINISSPNTPGLRDLQHTEALTHLLKTLKEAQYQLTEAHQKYVPLVVKISPDNEDQALKEMAQIFLEQNIDGVIATNTTINREGIEAPFAQEVGGLSGKPLSRQSTHAIKILHTILQDRIPIIASGGIMSEKDLKEKQEAGAALCQLYSGFIYAGPGLIRRLVKCY